MKSRRIFILVGILLVGLWVAGTTLAAAKQGSQPSDTGTGTGISANAKEPDGEAVTASGTISTKTVNDESYYVLLGASGETLYYLEFGPKWFYANNNKPYPFEPFINQQVTVSGEVEQPKTALPDNANPRAKANKAKANPAPTDAPVLDVFTINDQTLRAPGRPPWAGGPKHVPGHPGKKNK